MIELDKEGFKPKVKLKRYDKQSASADKTPKHSTNKKKTTKTFTKLKPSETILDRINAENDLFFFRSKPMNETQANILAEEIVRYAQEEGVAVTRTRFCKQRGISRISLAKYAKKFPCIDMAWKIATEYVGDNRHVGAILKNPDSRLVERSMPIYSKEWKELEEWRAEMKVMKDKLERYEQIIYQTNPIPQTKELDEYIKGADEKEK